MTVKELEYQIRTLTFAEKAQILQFLLHDFTAFWTGTAWPVKAVPKIPEPNEFTLQTTEFDPLAEKLMSAFSSMISQPVPLLSDHAISRAGIYEEHA